MVSKRKRMQALEQKTRRTQAVLRQLVDDQEAKRPPSRLRSWAWQCRAGLTAAGCGLGVWVAAWVVTLAGVPWTTVTLLGVVAIAVVVGVTRLSTDSDRAWAVAPTILAVGYLVATAVTS